ncbi:LOW QUALITY PROTEIN: hypothetical protein PanWU01x14_048740 [Parasponia andersonii]|uniref:Uncharacterized protein n=1 Tax=Parasponia andersonii TaxID=3476 RepID=A0A2P5DNE6_PARAD|nr:LOW QUALITY PROTEIN: hypothetical protein PanWU01x14_048740 [Parasponia andersonii]
MGSDNLSAMHLARKLLQEMFLIVGCRHSSIKTNSGNLHFPVGVFTWKKNSNYKKSYKYKL